MLKRPGAEDMVLELANPNTLIIGVQDCDGVLQNAPWRNNASDLHLLCQLYGRDLYDILLDDHGYISYHDNRVTLSAIFLQEDESYTMKIMGKVAESIIARRCSRSIGLNRMWMHHASNGSAVSEELARRYRAIGTGFKTTKSKYPTAYNPNDKQRDIIWIDEHNMHFPVNGSNSLGSRDAGLQIKASSNGMNYVYADIVKKTYEVPVVYFDFSGDYGMVFRRVRQALSDESGDSLESRFISIRDYDEDAFEEAEHYCAMVQAVINKRLKVEDLVRRAENYPTFGSAVMATAMESVAGKVILEASNDDSPFLQ